MESAVVSMSVPDNRGISFWYEWAPLAVSHLPIHVTLVCLHLMIVAQQLTATESIRKP
jgi:hypothetical protein